MSSSSSTHKRSDNSVYKMMFAFSSACHLAQRGDVDGLSKFLSNRTGLVNKTKKGRSLLHIACSKQNYDMVLMLLMRGADINAKDFTDVRKGSKRDGITPLMLCIQLKEENIGRLLIESGCSLEVTNPQGLGILHLCALHGCPRIANLAVDMGADVNQLSKDQDTPLMFALRIGSTASLSVALALVDKNADLHKPDINGLTPLKLAHERGYIGIESAIKYHIERQKFVKESKHAQSTMPTIPENEELKSVEALQPVKSNDEALKDNTNNSPNKSASNGLSKRAGLANIVANTVIQAASEVKDKSLASVVVSATSKRKSKSGRVSETGSVAESTKSKSKKEKNQLDDQTKPAQKRKSKVTRSNDTTPKGQLMCGTDRAKIQWFCTVQ
mmetsp:Transcript_19577/g.17773  ORF Transcript_19577/g.17773 Transcript_19577/m.17773 type:complete len:386 (-) Transcript_19577:963-2120(-)